MKITHINSGGVIRDQLQDKVSSKKGLTKTKIKGKEVNNALCACPVDCYPDPPGELKRRWEVYKKSKNNKKKDKQKKK